MTDTPERLAQRMGATFVPRDAEHLFERWPGYGLQSWEERFAELERRYRQLQDNFMAHLARAALKGAASYDAEEGIADGSADNAPQRD